MNFFVPYLDDRQSEQLWRDARATLRTLGLPTTERRIQGLALGAKGHILAVGMSLPDCGEPVLLILEARSIDIFYACTPSNGVDEGLPIPLGLTRDGGVIDFDPPRPRLLH